MFRKVLFLACAVSVLLVWNVQAAVINSNWIGGAEGEWTNPSNWNPNIVPQNGPTDTFNVFITSGQDIHIRINPADPVIAHRLEINKLDNQGVLDLEKDCDLLDFDVVVEGIDNYGNLTFSGEEDWTGGGMFTNHSGAVMNFGSPNNFDHNGSIINDGSLLLIGPSFALSVNGSIINRGSILSLNGGLSVDTEIIQESTGVIVGAGLVHADMPFVNNGTIRGTLGVLSIHTSGTLENNGFLENAPGSTLNIACESAAVQNNGTLTVCSGGAVTFTTNMSRDDADLYNAATGQIQLKGGTLAAGTITQADGASFSGTGSINADLDIASNNTVELSGYCTLFGDVTINTDAILQIANGVTLAKGHTNNDGTIEMIGGRYVPEGGLTNNGQATWQAGTYLNVADYNLDGAVNLQDFSDFAETWLWQSTL